MSNDEFDGTLDMNEARLVHPWKFERAPEDLDNSLKGIFNRLQDYALAHYNEDGWDFFVECWDFEDFESWVDQTCPSARESYNDLKTELARILKIQDDIRKDIRNA